MSLKSLLTNEDTCASAVLYAVEKILGEGTLLWEPQSIWMELKHQGIDLPVSNREQLMAARNLLTTGRFWYDATVFEKTCTAFNNEEINTDGLEEASVAYIAWTVWETHEIAKHYGVLESAVFDREPVSYTGVQLYRENFVTAPDELKWAQASLNRHYPKEINTLQRTVVEGWAAAPRDSRLRDAAFPETPEGVQLARLAIVQHHMNTRREGYIRDCAKVTSSDL